MIKNIILFCHLILLIACTGCGSKTIEAENPFKIDTSDYELLSQSTEGYNTIEVYQHDKKVIVNAKSEAAFFDGAQFIVESENELSTEDVTITWSTIGGGTEKTEDNARIICEVKIQENDTVILDKKINFLKKGFEAITEMLEERGTL
ncbi:hypothetical protein [Anaerotignum sp.]|uniref:hypothetical protein n=1 Tax=Anaerotignum sp. TaxID=2039241 RepID=UPI0027144D94|nr:hypothetical protein [Anaerotignum sp.]